MRARSIAIVVLAALGCACSPQDFVETVFRQPFAQPPDAGHVALRDDAGRTVFVAAIDGAVARVVEGSFTDVGTQLGVVVSRESGGHDQGTFIVMTTLGVELARYAPPTISPFVWKGTDEPIEQVNAPYGEAIEPFEYAGRRFVALATVGGFSPSALIVLEATSRTSLVPRVEFWNYGHLRFVRQSGPVVAAIGLNNWEKNEQHRYGATLLVLDLDDLLASARAGGPIRIAAPDMTPDAAVPAPARFAVKIPIDDPGGARVSKLEIEGAIVRADMANGLSYVLDTSTGDVTIEMDEEYADEYALRLEVEPDLPPTPAARLAGLRARTIVQARRD